MFDAHANLHLRTHCADGEWYHADIAAAAGRAGVVDFRHSRAAHEGRDDAAAIGSASPKRVRTSASPTGPPQVFATRRLVARPQAREARRRS